MLRQVVMALPPLSLLQKVSQDTSFNGKPNTAMSNVVAAVVTAYRKYHHASGCKVRDGAV
jgi:hypothetical protein